MRRKIQNKNYFSLMIWILIPIIIGSIIGYLSKSEINTWYHTLKRSSLTPPNYIFPIVWTVLYGIIGAFGHFIWHSRSFPKLNTIKILYISQLALNWSWTPLFFNYHLTGFSLIVLSLMDILVGTIIWLSYKKIKLASAFMALYLFWILFASYLNFYIWQYN